MATPITYADELKTYEREAKHLAALCAREIGTKEEIEAAWLTYCNLLHESTRRGRVWTPERVRALYPILREIKAEIDEIEREYQKDELRMRKQARRRSNAKAA